MSELATQVRRLHALAARISSYYPRSPGQPVPLGEREARAEARRVEARIRELRKRG